MVAVVWRRFYDPATMSLPARLCCPTSENSVYANFGEFLF
jgi:hypothetical protein